jgi:Raf kinase inhibitor-like YbhB/YbcL family protein
MMRALPLALLLSTLFSCSEDGSSPAPDVAAVDAAVADQQTADHVVVDVARSDAAALTLLSASIAPAGTLSYVLIMDDPDAPSGTFTHWVTYDIDAALGGLSGGLATTSSVPGVCEQGKNSFGKVGYGGPCPPTGSTHHYYFRLSALSVATLGLGADPDRASVEQAMQGNVLGQAVLMGTYSR